MVNRTLIRGLDNNIEDVVLNEDEFVEYISKDVEPQRDKIVEGVVVMLPTW